MYAIHLFSFVQKAVSVFTPADAERTKADLKNARVTKKFDRELAFRRSYGQRRSIKISEGVSEVVEEGSQVVELQMVVCHHAAAVASGGPAVRAASDPAAAVRAVRDPAAAVRAVSDPAAVRPLSLLRGSPRLALRESPVPTQGWWPRRRSCRRYRHPRSAHRLPLSVAPSRPAPRRSSCRPPRRSWRHSPRCW